MSAPGALGARLARVVAEWAARHGPGLVVGVSGPQGSGKSTACAQVAAVLNGEGLRTVVLSLDDLYLPRADRERLAREAHPLLATRGPPGTHDPALGSRLIEALRRPGAHEIPRFDKAADDRDPEPGQVTGPFDVVLFEGWCVGVRPQPPERLATPLNALERDEDAGGRWRGEVNGELGGPYAELWARLDRLVVLLAPDWSTVGRWRAEAEAELRAREGRGMAPDALTRFMAHYERLTLWAQEDLAPRADLVLRLDEGRRPLA